MFEEKSIWEQYKDAADCSEPILIAAPEKTVTVWLLTSHLTNQAKDAGHCWRNKDEFISKILKWTPTHGLTSVGQLAKIHIHQLCADNGCYAEDLACAVASRDR